MTELKEPYKEPTIILMHLGKGSLQQLSICTDSISQHEPNVLINIYTNESHYVQKHIQHKNVIITPWDFEPTESASYGSSVFHKMMLEKIRIIKSYYQRTNTWFLYMDSDVVVLRGFFSELGKAFQQHKMWIQCEGMDIYPRNHCCGIIAISKSAPIDQFLEEWEQAMVDRINNGPAGGPGDQGVFNQIINDKPQYPNWLATFPAGFASPGWMFHLFAPVKLTPVRPALYHANWITNKQEKLNRLDNLQFKSWKTLPFSQFLKAMFALVNRAWDLRYSKNPHNY